MPEETVAALDEAWRRHGLKSRMGLFRAALDMYLTSLEENEAAALVRAGSRLFGPARPPAQPRSEVHVQQAVEERGADRRARRGHPVVSACPPAGP